MLWFEKWKGLGWLIDYIVFGCFEVCGKCIVMVVWSGKVCVVMVDIDVVGKDWFCGCCFWLFFFFKGVLGLWIVF